jgi:PAS domain S-box-containing protein
MGEYRWKSILTLTGIFIVSILNLYFCIDINDFTIDLRSSVNLLTSVGFATVSVRLHQHIKNFHSTNAQKLHFLKAYDAFDSACIYSESRVDGTIINVNDNFLHKTGYSKEELIGQKHKILRSDCHTETFYDELWATILGGNIWQNEICIHNKSNEPLWFFTTIVPVKDANIITAFYCIMNDITQVKQAESEKQVLQNQLMQAQKMESIGQLTSGVAHDFNNLLMVVTGFSNLGLMLMREGDHEQGITCFEKVDESALRATDLVQKMLTFCRENTIKAEHPIDPSLVVNEVVGISKMLRSGISKTISIEFNNTLTRKSGGIVIDPSELHQLVTNLIINAKDAVASSNQPTGYISVNLYADQITHPVHCHACASAYQGDYIVLSVTDTGVGISAEKISRIFDPFFTTKGVGKGTGLGLSVVSGIVHNARGHILVESVVGQGTTFSLLFPAVHIKAIDANAEVQLEARPRLSEKAIRMAVIDDEEMICSLLHFSLTRLDYDVTVFSDPIDAWDTFLHSPDMFDVIVTDYGMPKATGLELANSMLTLRPEIPIVICTGYSDKLKSEQDLPKGNTFLFKKPTDIKVLDKTIRQFFDEKNNTTHLS